MPLTCLQERREGNHWNDLCVTQCHFFAAANVHVVVMFSKQTSTNPHFPSSRGRQTKLELLRQTIESMGNIFTNTNNSRQADDLLEGDTVGIEASLQEGGSLPPPSFRSSEELLNNAASKKSTHRRGVETNRLVVATLSVYNFRQSSLHWSLQFFIIIAHSILLQFEFSSFIQCTE